MATTPSTFSILQTLLLGKEFSGQPGYIGLLLLTLCPGIGTIGLNHVATGHPELAFFKASSIALSYLIMVFLAPFLPLAIQSIGSGTFLFWIAGIGPWYIFDCIQVLFMNNFLANGFISLIDVPMFPSGGGKGGKWVLTATFANLLFATIGGSGQAISYFFPDSATAGNVVSGIGVAGLGVSLLASGASMFAGSTAAAGGVGVAMNPLTAVGGGGSLPPLSHFIDKVQAGGAQPQKEPSPLLYGLAFIVLAGISLGLIRAKDTPV